MLLFSTWHNILKVFETALEKNEIATVLLRQNSVDKTIARFKVSNEDCLNRWLIDLNLILGL